MEIAFMHKIFPALSTFPLKPALTTMLTLCLCAGLAQAQNGSQPWQGTFTTVAPHLLMSEVSVNLPQAPAGTKLTIEQISVVVGPLNHYYGKFFSCSVESALSQSGTEKTRILLPPFSPVAGMSKTFALHTPLKLHAVPPTSTQTPIRVVCSVSSMIAGDTMTVTAVGYTTPL
jgi:hypothetical protein